MSSDQRASDEPRGALRAAWAFRKAVGARPDGSVMVELRGGRGALVNRAAAKRLATTIAREDAAAPSGGVTGWLERRQARRSALLVVPDRPTGVAVALRWRLDPQRFRLASEFDPAEVGPGDKDRQAAQWHSPSG